LGADIEEQGEPDAQKGGGDGIVPKNLETLGHKEGLLKGWGMAHPKAFGGGAETFKKAMRGGSITGAPDDQRADLAWERGENGGSDSKGVRHGPLGKEKAPTKGGSTLQPTRKAVILGENMKHNPQRIAQRKDCL